jgi:hypothetical protein
MYSANAKSSRLVQKDYAYHSILVSKKDGRTAEERRKNDAGNCKLESESGSAIKSYKTTIRKASYSRCVRSLYERA